ncbi:MAG: GAF domain-containing protein [Bacteroidota bacterium]
MLPASLHPEDDRLEALHRCEPLLKASVGRLRRLVRQACLAFRVPVSFISLLDADQEIFLTSQGVRLPPVDRHWSLGAYLLRQPPLLSVPDARADDRFRYNPFVTGEPNMRAYAAAPILSQEGHVIGALSIADSVPRAWDQAQLSLLNVMARSVLLDLMRAPASEEAPAP